MKRGPPNRKDVMWLLWRSVAPFEQDGEDEVVDEFVEGGWGREQNAGTKEAKTWRVVYDVVDEMRFVHLGVVVYSHRW